MPVHRVERKRCRPITLRNAMKIGPPVVLHKGRHGDGSGVRDPRTRLRPIVQVLAIGALR